MQTRHVTWESPLGELTLVADGEALAGLYFPGHAPAPAVPFGPHDQTALADARAQLARYFAGEATAFTIALAPRGTAFQRAVWARMCAIPCGETRTYGCLAAELAAHPRAVGSASAHNPISILIPCHRMVASSGGLAGYAGGLDRKRALLELERTQAARAYASGMASGPGAGEPTAASAIAGCSRVGSARRNTFFQAEATCLGNGPLV